MKIDTIISYLETKREYVSKKELENMKTTLLKIKNLEARKLLGIKEKGDLEYKKGNLKKAVELYSMYIDICPADYIVISNRAACYHKLELLKESIEDCKRGLKINPKFIKFYLRLGVLMADVDVQESIKYLEEALKLDPYNKVIKEQLEVVKSKEKPIDSNIPITSDVSKSSQCNNEGKDCCSLNFNKHLSEAIDSGEYDESIKNLVENKSIEELQTMVKEMMSNVKEKK